MIAEVLVMNQDSKKQRAIEDKRMKELKTVRKMIEIYCKGQHRRKSGDLCESCAELMHYAEARVERIKEVMRYSGPRMLWRHPIMTIRHILLGKGLLK